MSNSFHIFRHTLKECSVILNLELLFIIYRAFGGYALISSHICQLLTPNNKWIVRSWAIIPYTAISYRYNIFISKIDKLIRLVLFKKVQMIILLFILLIRFCHHAEMKKHFCMYLHWRNNF